MKLEMKAGAVNQVSKGTAVFLENEAVSYICVVIKGKVTGRDNAVRLSFGTGSFVGICDLFVGHYLLEYTAEEDSMLYAFLAQNAAALRNLLETNNKDYRGLMVNSMTKYFFELLKINKEYHKMASDLYRLLSAGHLQYRNFCKKGGVVPTEFLSLTQLSAFEAEEKAADKKSAYYEELAMVPGDVQKMFFACGVELAMTHLVELGSYITELQFDTTEVCDYLANYFSCLYNDSDQNLIIMMMRLAATLERGGKDTAEVNKTLDHLMDEFNRMEEILCTNMGRPPVIGRERLEKMYLALVSNGKMDEVKEESGVSAEEQVRLLKDSFKQILDYTCRPAEEFDEFKAALKQFMDLKDKMSTDDPVRMLRRKLSDGFYRLYEAVFLEYLKNENAVLPKAVELFLNYGFLDERLVAPDKAAQLCSVKMEASAEYHCTLFTLPEWLKAVYTGERQPSKNEFDLEYAEMLRDQRKTGEIKPEEEQEALGNQLKKLHYEIMNMFRYNHRLVGGQPSIFVPFLFDGQIMTGPDRAAVTKDRMGQTIEKYRAIDYSAFYRELMYSDASMNIDKEYEMKEVVPDIILLPVYGQNAVMWQEISCKRRDSAGRFLFPILSESSLDDMVVRTIGRYRWELCRTMQGTSWNNIQYKSLTSEYSDYIQFYRKNKELSEERKEKVKAQIAKGKNNTREIFLLDYELWIKAESAGAIRLNGVARKILAIYCPFNKETRESLATQPAFADAIGRFNKERMKKAKELEFRYHALAKQGIELTEPLVHTMKFYKDM